jgi:methionine synthase II (cobalamin-independent)
MPLRDSDKSIHLGLITMASPGIERASEAVRRPKKSLEKVERLRGQEPPQEALIGIR